MTHEYRVSHEWFMSSASGFKRRRTEEAPAERGNESFESRDTPSLTGTGRVITCMEYLSKWWMETWLPRYGNTRRLVQYSTFT